jgi:PAS domain S-box-containing protein
LAAADPDSGTELIFRRLSVQAPQHYRTWVRAAVAATILGYGLAFFSIQLEQPWAEQPHPRELYVISAGVVAAWLERKGRLQAAARLILAAIWLELHLSLLTLGPRAAVGGVFPAVLTGVILFFGARAGRIAALSALFSVPGFVLVGPLLGLGPGMRQGDLIYLVAIEASTLAIALLLALLMNTLGGVLQNAERDARRLRELIDGAPDAIILVNQQGTIEDCNPSAEALFHRTRAGLLGQRFEALELYAPNADGQDELAAVHAFGPEPTEVSAHLPTPNLYGPAGRTPLEGISREVIREDGSRDSLIVLRDLTQRKLADERTAQLQSQLQHSQKLEALGKLAGGVAHDFNNLLMAVGAYGEALAQHPERRVRDIADGLVGLRQRAAGLTGHLLAFARKGMTQPRPMDLALAVRESPRLLHTLIPSNIALEIDAPDPAFVYADPAQVEQVLLNLALNARDAMPNGGTLNIRCFYRKDVDKVELAVSDTGHGMDEATLRSAFEPFFTTKPKTLGTGLGLALVQGIMEASGGTIRLESTPGRGTSFTLSWRAFKAGSEPAPKLEATGELPIWTQPD